MGFSNPVLKTPNNLSEPDHHLTRTRCLCPERETLGAERPIGVQIGVLRIPLRRLWRDPSDDAMCRNTLRRLGILRRVSGRAQEKTPRSRISLPWGSSGVRPTVFEKETETRESAANMSGPDSHGRVRSSVRDTMQISTAAHGLLTESRVHLYR